VISNDELINNCWEKAKRQETFPNSVAQCIKEIRTAVDTTKRAVIITLPREGYRFAAPVSVVSAAAPEPTPVATEHSRVRGADALPPADSRLFAVRLRLSGIVDQSRYGLAASIAIVLVLAGGGWALRSWWYAEAPRELTMMTVPSIAVLPFKRARDAGGLTGGHAELADEISTQLLRVPRGFEIFVKSASAYRDKLAEPMAAGRELGVRYLVVGGVRAGHDVTHLNVQLFEAETGRQLWAQPLEYRPDEPGARNRTAMRIARLVTERVTATESSRPLPAEPRAAHYAIMGRALWAGERNGKTILATAVLFKKALNLDPNSVPALQGYARAKISAVLGGHVPPSQRLQWLDDAEKAIDSVIRQRRRSYGAYRLRGSLYRARGEWEKAVEAFKRALEINSDYAEAYGELGRVKIELGQAENALKDINNAIALSPTDSAALSGWHLWAGQAAIHLGKYEMGLNRLLDAEQADTANEAVPPWLALAYASLGQQEKARGVMAGYLRKMPGFTVAGWRRDNRSGNAAVDAQRERMARMLGELGVPEGEVRTGATR
jgi:TolB-like protein